MLQLEERTRWEEKFGVNFGKDVNQQDVLSRLRIGMQYRPTNWLKVTGLGQDARVSFYGKPAPNSLRDTIDLQKAYLAVSAGDKFSWRASFVRRMLNYGETRVIGTPQWSNVAGTYDHGCVGFSTSKASLEILMVSPVIVRPDEFNSPELGNRLWGTYNSFSGIWWGTSMDLFALRHSQSKIGGWTDKGTLGTNSFGGRLYGLLPDKFAYSLEAVGQTGHLGAQNQRAYAWFAGITRPIKVVNMPLSLSGEFKAASGSRYGSDHSATFDQLSPANHDKFGHEDLVGWRNINILNNLETLKVTKSVSFSLIYTNHFLFSASDALYNSQGRRLLFQNGIGSKTCRPGTGQFCNMQSRGPQLLRWIWPLLQGDLCRE